MKNISRVLLFLLLITGPAHSRVLKLGIDAELIGEASMPIFHGEIFIPVGENRQIFTGPYTLKIAAAEKSAGLYQLSIDLIGLGPDFKFYSFDLELSPKENTLVPNMPVKKDISANFKIVLLDDTGNVNNGIYPLADTSLWSISPSIHYQTHWIRGSLIDFFWNMKMGYLENIYNRFRESFQLSVSDRIDIYFHPEPTDQVFIDPEKNYSILPSSPRIDLIYGHYIDAISPVPGAELLIYRLWGYGPRWMVAGLANYYLDNNLTLRNFKDSLDKNRLIKNLADESWVRSDTGAVVCGSFVNWLLSIHSQSEFINLYKTSTSLDFIKIFRDIYGIDFDEVIDDYLIFMRNYQPSPQELGYYASVYFGQNNINRALPYYRELAEMDSDDRLINLNYLATCLFWLGQYSQADSVYDIMLRLGGRKPEVLYMKGDIQLALGRTNDGKRLFLESYNGGFATAGVKLVSILLDQGKIDSASVFSQKLAESAGQLLENLIEKGRLMRIRNQPCDSIMTQAAARALSSGMQSPEDPRPYFAAGKAFAIMKDYGKAMENLDIAYFLEINPYFQSSVLLETGRVRDLTGDRPGAEDYYRRVISSPGGQYQKSLAEKYIRAPYAPGN